MGGPVRGLASLLLASGCGAASSAEPPLVVDVPSLPHGQCENGAAGADGYFVGDLVITDGRVVGTERWVLFANEGWKKRGGHDCSLTWNVTGTVSTPSPKCPACERSLRVVAEPDIDGSDCPAELLRGRVSPEGRRVGGEAVTFQQQYDLRTTPDGTVVLSFAATGREVGQGRTGGDRLVWLSGHQCKFF